LWHQLGGLMNVNSNNVFAIGNGAAGTYSMSGGTFNAPAGTVYVGNDAAGTFNQSGGTATIMDLNLSNSSASTGVFQLSGGTLNVASHLYVGHPFSNGTFIQSAGTGTIAMLLIGGRGGNSGCFLDGGTLSVGTVSCPYFAVTLVVPEPMYMWLTLASAFTRRRRHVTLQRAQIRA
jgi:hypothetical protein